MDQDDNIGDLSRVKQLTSSIRFESEDVRRQVEQMLAKYQQVSAVLAKNRDLTKQESELAKSYLAAVSKLGQPLGEQARGLNDASKALLGMEAAVNRYAQAATKAEAVSGRLSDKLKGASKELRFRQDNMSGIQQSRDKAAEQQSRFESLTDAVRARGPGKDDALRAALGGEGDGLDSKKLRRLGSKKLASQRTQLAAELGTPDDSQTSVSKALRDQVAQQDKLLATATKEEAVSGKKVKQLQAQRKLAEQIKSKNEEALKTTSASLQAHEKLLPKLAKRFGTEDAAGSAAASAQGDKDQAQGGGSGRGPGRYGYRGTHGLMGNLGLNLLSDVGIPGVSDVARVERYRRMASDAAQRYQARRDEQSGAEEGSGGGMLGKAAGLLANPIGLAVGGLAVAGGFAIHKGRQAMGVAEGMAGPQRTLMGQVGGGRLGAADQAYSQDLTGYGIDARQAQGALIGLNRQVGGRAGAGQLRQAAALGQGYGMDVGEIGSQAGQLIRAGGSSPQAATQNLQKIMSEGVKAGIDRARITEFTSEVISIQEQLLRDTGANNAQAIAKSLAQFMAGSGKQGQEFMQGAGFQGLMGIDRSMKGFARGASGPGAGTLYRAFAPGAEGQTPSDRYVSLNEKMEGGLFGGKGKDNGAARAKQVLEQYFKESGAGDLFNKKTAGQQLGPDDQRRYQSAENVVRTRMQGEMGVGFGQSKELLKIMENIDQKMATPEGQKELEQVMKDMGEKSKDPLVALGDKMAQANNSLIDIAKSAGAIRGFIGAKDMEIATNKLAKPMVEAGGEMFGSAVDGFSSAVKSFQESIDVLGKVFGKDTTTPEQKAAMDKGLQSMTGQSTEQFKDSGGMWESIMTLVKGAVLGMHGDAAPPKAGDPVPTSATGVQLTPESLKAIMGAKGQDSSSIVDALKMLGQLIKDNTAVTSHGNNAILRGARSGNVGGAAGR